MKPMDLNVLEGIAERFSLIVTVEENVISGGFGAAVSSHLADRLQQNQCVVCLGLPDRFVEHGPRKALLEEVGLNPDGIAVAVLRHYREAKQRV